jgi:copper transport protein
MMPHVWLILVRHRLLVALLFAACLALVLPGTSEAQAALLRSDPAQGAVLPVAPDQVRMWFSEALNPSFSTAVVESAANKRVDYQDAHISSNDAGEMDLNLQPNLPPAVYVVVWRTVSAADGHILSGSFRFTVARLDGTVPTLTAGTVPGQHDLGGNTLTGQFDGLALFNLIMVTLVELGAVFWVGAQFWLLFLLQSSSEDHEELSASNQKVQQRFEQRLSLPTLLVLLLANAGVLLGQAIGITGGNVASAIAPSLLVGLVTSGSFGSFWLMRMIVLILAMRLSLYRLQVHRLRAATPSRLVGGFTLWANLVLGLALFIAIAVSGDAAAVSGNSGFYALVADYFHLVAAALWVGGMIFIATSYLPILRRSTVVERARSLVTILPYSTPWAVAGVIILAVTGPFSATVHLALWEQLLSTAYGRALVVKLLLVGALLLTGALHIGLLRPRLKKEVKKYAYALARLQASRATAEPQRMEKLIARQVKLRERRLAKQSQHLTRVLGFEPVLGVAVLVCVGLMNVFAGTLVPTTSVSQPQPTATSTSFTTSVRTSDNKFRVTLVVNPNFSGTNIFTASVIATNTGKPITNVGVTLYISSLIMDMGVGTVNLQPDGKGHFSARSELPMGGDWQVRIELRMADNKLHEAVVKLPTPL